MFNNPLMLMGADQKKQVDHYNEWFWVDFYGQEATIRFPAIDASTLMYTTEEPRYRPYDSQTDDSAWTPVPGSLKTIHTTTGRVWLRGNSPTLSLFSTYNNGGPLEFTKPCKVGGNINTLIADRTPVDEVGDYAFAKLFQHNSDNLMDASALVLPAKTLGSYCYSELFCYCDALKHAPSELPAIEATNNCYRRMFLGCTSLQKAPNIKAQVPVNYAFWFMFNGATKLNFVRCDTVYPAPAGGGIIGDEGGVEGFCDYWLQYVADVGVFVKKAGVEWPTGVSGIPEGWITIDDETFEEEYGGATHILIPQKRIRTWESSPYRYDIGICLNDHDPLINVSSNIPVFAFYSTYNGDGSYSNYSNVIVAAEQGISVDTTIYVGRYDSRRWCTTTAKTSYNAGKLDVNLSTGDPWVTEADIGKAIPVYISTEPAPWMV